MTPLRLANKIMELRDEVLIQEMSNEELENLVEDLIYGVQEKHDTIDVVIEPLDGLPCSLKIFTINGNEAYASEFGESLSTGSCMHGACHHEFKAFSRPDKATMRKYGITEDQFHDIGEMLENKLYVSQCGLCS